MNSNITAIKPEQIVDILKSLTEELHPHKNSINISRHASLEADLGIDSLARMELIQRLETRLGVQLDEKIILGAALVSDLIEGCGTKQHQTSPQINEVQQIGRVEKHGGFPDEAITMVEALEWHASRQGDNPAIYFYEGPIENPDIITYRDLWNSARRVATGLNILGVEQGQSIALMLPTSRDFLASFFGILMAGAVPIPIYPPFRLAQIEEHIKRQVKILDNAQARLLITVDEAMKVGNYLKASLPDLIDVTTYDALRSDKISGIVRRSGNDTAFMQYTSGSTGTPKGVVLTHKNLLANVRAMGKALGVTPDDTFISWLPLYHDMGLIGAWLGSLYHGFPLVLMPPLSFIARPQRWLQAISKHKGTLSAAPNFAYEICVKKIRDEDIQGLDLSSMRFSCNGAEPVHHETLKSFIERFSRWGYRQSALSPVYGLAECSVGLAFPPLDRGPKVDIVRTDAMHKHGKAVPALEHESGTLHIVACGYPLPDHEIRIVDEHNHEIGERQVGLLQFRGPSATAGYYRNKTATEALLYNDWLNSGDYAYIADGEIYITGRSKDLIIRAGRNIYPYELEQGVGQLQGIQKGNVAVFGSKDKAQGTEKLVILAETRERRPEKLEALKQKITALTIELIQMPPDDIVLAPLRTILKTSSGKIRRVECRELYEQNRIGKKNSVTRQFIHLGLSAVFPWLKRKLRALRGNLYVAYSWIVFGSFTLFTIPAMLIIPGRTIPNLLLKTVLRIIFLLLGIRYRAFGKENIPKDTPCIMVSNHMSYIDVFSLGLSLPANYGFVAKAELKGNWIARMILNKFGTHFVERFDVQKSLKDSDQILESTRNGNSIVFFPEGTFSRAPGLRSFKMGAFTTASTAGVPVLPATIRGTRQVLRGADWRPRPGIIEVEFSPLISTDKEGWDGAVELRAKARDAISKNCREPDLSV